jgi:TonB-dependent starch-binding outer membrane protein SusC
MKRILFLFTLLLLTGTLVMAQTVQITGTVTSSEDGMPMPGVSVVAKGTTVGATTGSDGKYSINVPANVQALQFSFIGYTSQEVLIAGKTRIDVAMITDLVQMEEIVVVGFGVQKKRDIAGAISSVKADAIERAPVASFDKAIQGRASGVQVTASTGIPGGNVSMRIRGRTSITAGTQPLYIIDGVPMTTGDNSQMTTSSNSLAGLNPNDIESIDILKDAGSASIYGAQAANGVVLITTKRGKDGKTKFNFTASKGYNTMIKNFSVLTGPQFVDLTLEAYRNAYGATGTNYLNLITSFKAKNWLDASGNNIAPNYDWVDAVMRKGIVDEYMLSAAGGNDKTQFFTSGSYNKTQGQVIGTDFSRVTFRSNINHKVNNKLSFETNLGLSSFNQTTQPAAGAYANPSRSGYLIVPTNPIYDVNSATGYTESASMYGGYTNNVVFNAKVNYIHNTTSAVVGSFMATYKIIDGLTFKSSWNLDFQDILEEQFYDPRSNDGSTVAGRIYQYDTRIMNWSTDQTFNYSKVFADVHNVSAVAGFTYRNSESKTFFGHGTGLPSPQFQLLNAVGTPQSVGASYNNWKLAGMFARFNYTYNDKYIASFTGRYDGSSRFGANNKYGFFPAAQLAWRISSESFMESLTFIEDMKLKLSYGVTGNSSIGNYAAVSRYGIGGTYLGSRSLARQLGNPDITWETSTSYDMGMTVSLFKGRIGVEADYYIRDSKDLLLDRPLPRSTGFGSITMNIGSLRNTGFEFQINSFNVKAGDFEWKTDLNFTFQHIEITSLIDSLQDLGDQRNKIGYQPWTQRLRVWAGVNPADGRPMFYDKNGNITYRPVDADYVWQKRGPEPTFFGGISNDLSFKGITLSAFFQFSTGNNGLNSEATFLNRSGNTAERNQYTYVYDRRWTTPGQITDVSKPWYNNTYLGGAISPYTTSTYHYEPLDYLRLKNIMLSYNIPTSLLRKIKIESLQIFAQGTNLWTKTYYTGYDPEFSASDGDFGTYPQSKSYTFGIKMSF